MREQVQMEKSEDKSNSTVYLLLSSLLVQGIHDIAEDCFKSYKKRPKF